MNTEKQIALAIMDGIKMYYDSWNEIIYTKQQEECLKEACQKHDLSANMWSLLSLACYWSNDVQDWARDVLNAEKN